MDQAVDTLREPVADRSVEAPVEPAGEAAAEPRRQGVLSGVGPVAGLVPLIIAVVVGLGLMLAIALNNSTFGLTGSGSTTTYRDIPAYVSGQR